MPISIGNPTRRSNPEASNLSSGSANGTTRPFSPHPHSAFFSEGRGDGEANGTEDEPFSIGREGERHLTKSERPTAGKFSVQAVLPIERAAARMSYRDDQALLFVIGEDHHVGESLEQMPTNIVRSRITFQRWHPVAAFLDCRPRQLKFGVEILLESRAARVVPVCGLISFIDRFGKQADVHNGVRSARRSEGDRRSWFIACSTVRAFVSPRL